MIDRWIRFWFTPTTPTNLGVSRMLFFGGMLAMYVHEDFSAWGNISDAFWLPIPLFAALHVKAFDVDTLVTLQAMWRVALALSAIGLLSRVAMTVSFVVGVYLLGLPHNFGQTYHFDALLVLVMGVLAASRAGDACSVDAWLEGVPEVQPSGEYTWPLRAIWVAMALVFFAAGFAKVRYGGVAWITSNNMSILLTRALYHVSDADPMTRAGLWIAQRHWFSSGLAAGAVAIELGFPLALISRRARALLVPAAFGMLIGIRILMGPTFGGFLVAGVFWIPWDALKRRFHAQTGDLEDGALRRLAPSYVSIGRRNSAASTSTNDV
jgi:hypothetical protein